MIVIVREEEMYIFSGEQLQFIFNTGKVGFFWLHDVI
jgi:hypothetical protein